MILALSKLTGTAANTDRFVALMRETKALLGTIEAAIREVLQQGSNARPLSTVKPVAPVPAPTVVPTEKTVCIQVIQPAKDPQSGACKEFPTPCDVPLGWVPVNACAVPEAEKTLPRTDAENAPSTTAVQPSTWTISISEEGFFPNEVKVRKGDKVIWKNTGSHNHWPASAVHPTHQLYPEFDARQGITSGASYSFVFDRVGTWKYHDHLNPGFTGAIVVSE